MHFSPRIPVIAYLLTCSVPCWAMKDVSVRDYGARGNEYHDDAAAFQKALDEVVAAGGGRIHVPAGDYIISRKLSVVVPNDRVESPNLKVALVGEGPRESRLMSTSKDGLLHFETARNGTDVTVRGLALMAREPGAGTALSIICRVLGGVRVERAALVENVFVGGIYDGSHFSRGIFLSGQWRPLVRDVEIRGAVSESLADDSPAFAMEAGIRMDAFYAGRFVNCHVSYADTGYKWEAAENGEGFVLIDSVADHVRVGAVIATPEQEPGGCMVRTSLRARDVGLRIDHKRLVAVIHNIFEPLSPDGAFPYTDVSISNSWAIQVNRNEFRGSPENRTHVRVDGRSDMKDYVVMPFTRFIQINGNEMVLPPERALAYSGDDIFGVFMESNAFSTGGVE